VKGLIAKLRGTPPVNYVSTRLQLAEAYHANQETYLRAMSTVGVLFAIVTKNANGTAQSCWSLYRKAPSGLKEDRTPVTRHAALDMWRKPNPFFTNMEFVESFQQHLELTGEAYWVVHYDERAPDLPLYLWPVRPDRMYPVPSAERYLAGYIYCGPGGEKVPLELKDVIQLRMPNPLDPYRGLGPVQAAMVDLDSARYSAEWNRNFFVNSAEPGGIIEVDRRLSDDEFREMTQRWREQHGGVAQAHRVAVLEQGKWVDRKYTQRDMQFTELLTLSDDKIRRAFAFPKPMLGDTEDINRANAEAGEVIFARWTLIPRLERIKAALNDDLLPLFGATGRDLEFDYDSPVPDDRSAENEARTSKANAAATLVQAGFDPEDVCNWIGIPVLGWSNPNPPAPAVAPNAGANGNGSSNGKVPAGMLGGSHG
jgi:HK97 family phage portal protein